MSLKVFSLFTDTLWVFLACFLFVIKENPEIFLEKSVDFTGNFGGKLRQETISKKEPILRDFFGQISLKSINLALIWPALCNVF